MAIGIGVKSTHRDYDNFLVKWRRCRDVSAGQDAIHAGGVRYLPQLTDQSITDYDAYVARAPFYNATWRTIAGFTGMLFRKPPTIEVPKRLEELLKDVTMSGISFDAFAQDCAVEDLEVSRVGILVDHPAHLVKEDGSAPTVAEAEAAGQRPFMQQYKAEAIRNWKYGRVNNKTVLVQVRLGECVDVPKDGSEFQSEQESRIRVLDLIDGKYRQRVFKEDNEEQIGSDIFPTMDGQFLDHIPFYFIGPDGTEGTVDEPILIDLINVNIKHYQVGADHAKALHMLVPTPWVTGYKPQFDGQGQPIKESFYIGSDTAWVFPDPTTQVGMLEFTGAGLQAYENDLTRKEAQMAAIGARMLAPEKSGVEAEGTLAMRHSGEGSILSAIAIAVSGGLTKALNTFAKWAGEKGECKFEINRDFLPVDVSPQTLTAWLALVQAGRMSPESLFSLMKRGDLIEADVTFEIEQARSDAVEPPAPIAPRSLPKPSNAA